MRLQAANNTSVHHPEAYKRNLIGTCVCGCVCVFPNIQGAPNLSRLSRGDTLYCSFRAASGGGPLAGMQDIARMPTRDMGAGAGAASGTVGDADDLDFYSFSDAGDDIDFNDIPEPLYDTNTLTNDNVLDSGDNNAQGGPGAASETAVSAGRAGGAAASAAARWCLTDVDAISAHVAAGFEQTQTQITPTALLVFIGPFVHDPVAAASATAAQLRPPAAPAATHTEPMAPAMSMHVPGSALYSIPEPSDTETGHDGEHEACQACSHVATLARPGCSQIMLLASWPDKLEMNIGASGAPEVNVALSSLPVLVSASIWDYATAGLIQIVRQFQSLRRPQTAPPAHQPVRSAPSASRPGPAPVAPRALPISAAHITAPDVCVYAYVAPPSLVRAAAAAGDGGAAPHMAEQPPADLPPGVGGPAASGSTAIWCSSPCVTLRLGAHAQLDTRHSRPHSASLHLPAVTLSVGQLALQHHQHSATANRKRTMTTSVSGTGNSSEDVSGMGGEGSERGSGGSARGMGRTGLASSGVWAAAAQVEPLLHCGVIHLSACVPEGHHTVHVGDVSVYAAMRSLAASASLAAELTAAIAAMKSRAACRAMHAASVGELAPPRAPLAGDVAANPGAAAGAAGDVTYPLTSPFSYGAPQQQQQAAYGSKPGGLSGLGGSPGPGGADRSAARQSIVGGSDDGSLSLLQTWQAQRLGGLGNPAMQVQDVAAAEQLTQLTANNPFSALPPGKKVTLPHDLTRLPLLTITLSVQTCDTCEYACTVRANLGTMW